MGYYTRVLTTSLDPVPIAALERALTEAGVDARIEIEQGDTDRWEEFVLVEPDGAEIAAFERNVVEEGSLGEEEIEEFLNEVEDGEPESAVEWLQQYLPKVRCIYAVEHLNASFEPDGFEALAAVREAIWQHAGGIIQADNEGFTNEDGFQITWDFEDDAEGEWWMGVLQRGQWVHFKMDLANPEHRKEFMAGRIPSGVELA